MLTFIAIFLSVLLSIGFVKNENENPWNDYVQNGQAIILLKFANVKDTISYLCFYNTQLPSGQKVHRFQIYSDSVIEIKINAGQPTITNLHSDSVYAGIYTIPGDTAIAIIGMDAGIDFQGKNSKISNYLSKEKVYLYDNFPEKNESPKDYNLRIDSQYIVALKAFENYLLKEKLPEWFIETEKTDIWIYCEFLKQIQYNQRYWKYNQYIENKSVITSKVRSVELSLNSLSENVTNYLSGIRPARYDTLLMPQHINSDIVLGYTRENILSLKGRLSDKLFSYYIASNLSGTIKFVLFSDFCKLESAEKFRQIDDLMREMLPLIKDSVIKDFIRGFKANSMDKFLNQKKLQKGQKATDFYLEDNKGTMVNLPDFKGKVILLNFWGTYCSPCIQSIPQKNELVRRFDKNQFVLINIVMDFDFKAWRKIIEEKQFEGIHLKCKENWPKILTENYLIKGVPHYAIIDKKGNIIVNDAKRDSLEYYLSTELKIDKP